jgi:pimeloyl-ACP methyl ester carboxylesterase
MTNIAFREKGKGQPLLLIHGFPMNQDVWNTIAESLSQDFKVITIDLPGFGQSPLLQGPFSIDQVADAVLSWLAEKNIQKTFIAGHSLGGYVTLAMLKKDPNRFPAAILLHSTALPDGDEKKQSRNKTLEFIEKNGVQAFTSNFIGPLFSDSRHPAIESVRAISMKSSKDSVMGYTKAMRDRLDRTDVLKKFPGKILLIGGEKDQGIPASSLKAFGELNASLEVEIVPDIAHMGMFEAEEKVLQKFRTFFKKNSVT